MQIKPLIQVKPKDLSNYEMTYIKRYGTLFPYGGNERLGKLHLDAQEYYDNGNCICSLFTHVKSKRGVRGGRGTGRITDAIKLARLTPAEVLENIKLSKYNASNYVDTAKTLINRCSKDILLDVAKMATNMTDKHLHRIIIDLCRHSLSKLTKVRDVEDTDFIVFTYTNRYMETLNLHTVCNDNKIKSLYWYPIKTPNFTNYLRMIR